MAVGYGSSIVTNGLVLCLDAGNVRSYTGSGTTWTDLSGRNNTGTLVNGTGFSSNNAGILTFDGANDYVNFGNNTDLNSLAGDFTFEIWVNLLSGGSDRYGRVIANGNYAGSGIAAGFAMIFDNVPNILAFSYADPVANIPDGTGGNSNILVNTWYQIVITRVGSTLSFYRNGALIQTRTYAASLTTSLDFTMGVNPSKSEPCRMQVGAFRRYNRGISADEVLQNFNAHRGRFGI